MTEFGRAGTRPRLARRFAAPAAVAAAAVTALAGMLAFAPGVALASPTISQSPDQTSFTQPGQTITITASVDQGGGEIEESFNNQPAQEVAARSDGGQLVYTLTTGSAPNGTYSFSATSNAYQYNCTILGCRTQGSQSTGDVTFTINVPAPSPSPTKTSKATPTGSASSSPSGSPSAAPSSGGQPGPTGSGTPSQPASPAGGSSAAPGAKPGAPSTPPSPIKLSLKSGAVPSTTGFGGGKTGILGLTSVFGSLAVPGLPAPVVAPTPEGTYSATLDYGDQSVPERYRAKEAAAEAAPDSATGQLTRALAAALVLVLGSAHLRLWLRSPVEDEEY